MMPDDTEVPVSSEIAPLAEIAHKQFTVVLRGYDRDEVDQFLAQIEDAVQELVERAGRRPSRDHIAEWLGREVTAVIAAAEDAAAKIGLEAATAAEELKMSSEAEVVQARADAADARDEAERTRTKAEEEAAEIRLEAQENADRNLREARLTAERIENAARAEKDRILAEARQDLEDLKERENEIHSRIAALEETFGALRTMVGPRPAADEGASGAHEVVDLETADTEERKR